MRALHSGRPLQRKPIAIHPTLCGASSAAQGIYFLTTF